jgi:flagellar protein FlaG
MSINSIPVNTDSSFAFSRSGSLDNSVVDENSKKAQVLADKKTIDGNESVQEVEEKLSVAESIAKSAKEQDVSSEDVEKALDIVASYLSSTMKQVDFSSDNSAGKTVITVIDKETQEVINQFPSEKIVSMAEKIQQLHQEAESISGLLIDSHV